MSDSTRQELSKFTYNYLFEIKKIRSINTDDFIYAQKRVELKTAFERDLKEKFGNCVYKKYRKFISGRYPDRVSNRITER